MASCTMYKIIFDGVLLPDIYFTWDEACERLHAMEANSPRFGRVVLYDNENDCLY